VTCGKEHMVQWRANCGLLTYENYKMDAESITIYCLALVKENLVSGSEDGYLYIWENKKIAKRQEAHPREAILALYCSQDSRIFASGGTDGKVILWQLTSNILQKLYEYSVYEGPIISNITPTKYHIQSICISSTKLIAGTRSGDIYEFDRPV
jgi:WD40 repeat protein